MQWYPVGPDLVFSPADPAFTRLSPANEYGMNGRVLGIAMSPSSDPLHPTTLFVVGGEGSSTEVGSTSVFQKRSGDSSWSCPGDALLAENPFADPACVAVHPSFLDHFYLGTWQDQGVYLYDATGGVWSARSAIPGRVRKIVVDPRPVATLGATILYAATDTGIYLSNNNGSTWTAILAGDVWSLAVNAPATGSPRFYAGLASTGVWFADTYPTGPSSWTNLNATASLGLPATASFEAALVDFCPNNPDCAYAWFGRDSGGDTLCSTRAPRTAWSVANANPNVAGFELQQWQTFGNFNFAVAPDSPGDGANDVLFFGSLRYARSADAGRTWTLFADTFHVDVHAFAFAPAAGTSPPAFYLGCDGGLSAYARATVPGFAPDYVPTADDRSTQDVVEAPTKTFVSANRGAQDNCAYALGQDPAGLTQLYMGCVDTGIAFRDGGLGWSVYAGGDAFKVAVARQPGGVLVRQELFGGIGVGGKLNLSTHSVAGGVAGDAYPVGDVNGSVISTSNYVIDDSGNCVAGGFVDSVVAQTTAMAPALMGANTTILVGTTTGITDGSSISFDNDRSQFYDVFNVTATTFDIRVLYHAVPASTAVRLLQLCAFRNAPDRSTARISQIFTPNDIHNSVTAFARGGAPGAINLACATRDDTTGATNLWTSAEAPTLGATPPVWTTVPLGSTTAPPIVSMSIDASGDTYVLFLQARPDPAAPATVTPLFRIPAGTSTIHGEACSSLPTGTLADGSPVPFGKMVVDPVRPNVFHAIFGSAVYSATLATSTGTRVWSWVLTGTGLPGAWVTDLSITNVAASGATPKVILRACTDGRGVWEVDVSSGATPPASDLYVRRHLLDEGWTSALRDALPHPYRPGETVWHYESVDIKVDRMVSVTSTESYFQTDPDASGSIYTDPSVPAGPVLPSTIAFSNVQYDMMNDFGQAVPSGNRVRVHVQVQNRSTTPLDGVSVWALWTHPSGGLPALNLDADGTTFDFWGQFRADGTIVAALPAGSLWQSVGAPISLSGIDAAHPQIATWNWDAPTLDAGATAGHYCLAVFIHSLSSPINETTNYSVDDIVLHNKQVGQKNLHVIAVAMSGAAAGGMMSPAGGSHLSELTIAFHNPTSKAVESTLVIDVARLVKGVAVGLQLAQTRLKAPLEKSIVNAADVTPPAGKPARFPEDLLKGKSPAHGKPAAATYVADAGKSVSISGVLLDPNESASVRLLLRVDQVPAALRSTRLSVRQLVGKRVVGGSTIEIRFVPDRKRLPRLIPPTVTEEIVEAEGASPGRSRPVWIEYLRKQRAKARRAAKAPR